MIMIFYLVMYFSVMMSLIFTIKLFVKQPKEKENPTMIFYASIKWPKVRRITVYLK